MRRLRKLVLAAAITILAAACGGPGSGSSVGTNTSQAIGIVRLKPGHYTFHLGGRLKVGDELDCVTRSGAPAGGGSVPKAGHGVSSSTGFSVVVFSSGKVRVTCPAHAGNA